MNHQKLNAMLEKVAVYHEPKVCLSRHDVLMCCIVLLLNVNIGYTNHEYIVVVFLFDILGILQHL